MTLGYERWANLAPSVVELQSFGHAFVSEDGELTIKLINIDGNVLYEKTMTPVSSDESSTTNITSPDETTATESTSSSSSEGSMTTSTVIDDTSKTTSTVVDDTSMTTSTISEGASTDNSTTTDSADKGGVSSSGSVATMMSFWSIIVVFFVQW